MVRLATPAPPSGPAAPPLLSAASGFAGGYIRLHALDVTQSESAHEPRPEQWLDVGIDPASVHAERRCLDRSPVASQNTTGLGLLEIPIADLADGHAGAHRVAIGRGVFAFC